MNKTKKILDAVSDDDLRQAVAEIRELVSTGVMADGVTRLMARTLVAEVGIDMHSALICAKTGLMERAAFKWLDSSAK